MADDESGKADKTDNPETAKKREEEQAVKVYDSQLMRRLAGYVRPYWVQAIISAVAVSLKSLSDVIGPFLVMVGIDHYFPGGTGRAGAQGFASGGWITRLARTTTRESASAWPPLFCWGTASVSAQRGSST